MGNRHLFIQKIPTLKSFAKLAKTTVAMAFSYNAYNPSLSNSTGETSRGKMDTIRHDPNHGQTSTD
jgi:hypothetical protein